MTFFFNSSILDRPQNKYGHPAATMLECNEAAAGICEVSTDAHALLCACFGSVAANG